MIYPDIQSALKVTISEIETAAEKTLEQAGEFAREEALATDLFKVGGNFRQHTQFTKLDRFNGFVRTDLDYAGYLEFGNGPGRIVAKNAKALHFQIGGKDIFVKSVRSHGPLPYMQNAGEKLEQVIDTFFVDNLTKTVT